MGKRTNYANEMLEQTMLRMLREESVDKISITKVCREAHVSRPSFYYYYKDIPHLVWMGVRNAIRMNAGQPTGLLFSDEALAQTFLFLRENKDIILNMRDSKARASIMHYMFDDIKRFVSWGVREFCMKKGVLINEANEAFIVDAASSMLLNVIRAFMEADLEMDVQELASQCSTLMNATVSAFIDERLVAVS